MILSHTDIPSPDAAGALSSVASYSCAVSTAGERDAH